MARNRHVSWAVALSAAAALAVSLSACSSTAEASKAGTFYGAELALGNGKVKTYVATGNDGKPTELGSKNSGSSRFFDAVYRRAAGYRAS